MEETHTYASYYSDEQLSQYCRQIFFKHLDECTQEEIDEVILTLDSQLEKEPRKYKLN